MHRMTRFFLVALAPLLALPVSRAQQVSLTPQDPPLLSISDDANTVRLLQAKVDTVVLGGLAQTTVELVFFNYGDRLLEGQLNFPLRDGQRITGFALDVDGKMRDAVPVPKQKGRVTFESIERRQVDPGLLEQTVGHHFRLRVYPIPQGGTRKVRLVYSEDLALVHGEYRLPVSLAQLRGAAELRWSLRVQAANQAPTAVGTLARSLAFKRTAGGWESQLRRAGYDGGGTLEVQLPHDQQARVYTQQSGDEIYFLAEQPLPQADGTAPRRALPHKVAVLWDSSASARERNREAELTVLSRYLAALGHAEVSLIRLRDVAEPVQQFSISGGDASTLFAALRDTDYDGASQLTGWKPLPGVQEYLLFSDGLQNYGSQRDLPTLPSDVRLYALHAAGAHADGSRLRQWAESRHGHLIAIDPAVPQAAVDDLLSTPAQLLDVELIGGDDWVVPTYAPRDGVLRVAGRLVAQQGQLRLRYRDARGQAQEVSLPIDARQAALSGPVPQTWASYWIQRWSADPDAHSQQIRQTSERFGLVSAQTSLIVLETAQDYVEHAITPPAELKAEYSRLREQQRVAHDSEEAERLDDVAEGFQDRISWWEKSWPKGPLPTAEPEAKRERQRRRATANQAREASASAAPPPAAMSPLYESSVPLRAPGTVVARATSDTLDSVVVTGTSADSESNERQIQITVQPWQPDSVYAKRLRAALGKQAYRVYLDEREAHRDSTAFYLDVADILFEKGERALALRVLSNLAELGIEDRGLLRVLAFRLNQAGEHALALPVLQQVKTMADEEPQSHRDLGLALAAVGQEQAAIDALYTVVTGDWDERFGDVSLIALGELNAIVAAAKKPLDTRRVDPRLLRNLPVDLRVVLSWDTDNSDMDLWVTDPNGEKCFYSFRSTYQGGHMSEDLTGGYGPEEFLLRQAKPGKYKVEANFYGERQALLTGGTSLQVLLYRHYGSARVQVTPVVLRLKQAKDTILVGEFEVR